MKEKIAPYTQTLSEETQVQIVWTIILNQGKCEEAIGLQRKYSCSLDEWEELKLLDWSGRGRVGGGEGGERGVVGTC